MGELLIIVSLFAMVDAGARPWALAVLLIGAFIYLKENKKLCMKEVNTK